MYFLFRFNEGLIWEVLFGAVCASLGGGGMKFGDVSRAGGVEIVASAEVWDGV